MQDDDVIREPGPEHLAVLYAHLAFCPRPLGAENRDAPMFPRYPAWAPVREVLGREFRSDEEEDGWRQIVETADWKVAYRVQRYPVQEPGDAVPYLHHWLELESFTGDIALFIRDVFFVRMAH